MADALTDALQSLEGDSLLTKASPENNFIDEGKSEDNSQYAVDDSQKGGFDFEVNLQPEKIVEVANLPDGSRSYRMKWKDTWIHEGLMPAYQNLVDQFWTEQKHANKEKQVDESPEELDFTIKALDTPPEEDKTKDDEQDKQQAKLEAEKQSLVDNIENSINMILLPDKDEEKPEEVKNNEEMESKIESKIEEKIGRKRKIQKVARSKKEPKKVKVKVKDTKKVGEGDEKENENKPDGTGDFDDLVDKNVDHLTPPDTDITSMEGEDEKFAYPEDKGPCTCNICGKVISNKYGLREHQSVVHFKNGKFQCEICGKRVTNKRALTLHMTSHSTERKFVCELCGSSHKTKGNLNYHIKTMHTMIKNFRCDICFKTFKVQAELKEHCFTVHSNEGVITCIVCKKKLTTALSIYTHSVMHSGAREHECTECGYAFKTATGLKEHMVTHSEEKPVRQCPHCDRKFYSRSQYNAHVMRHTADGGLITYKCPECDVKFQHKSSYNRHVIRHQPGGDLEFPKKNPYLLLDESELPEGVCHKCRKHYSSKSGFYLHLKKCRDGIVQQFQCPFCERGCSNRSSLKRHIQRRHKGMEFEGQTVRGRELQTDDVDDTGGTQQAQAVLTQDGIQYQQYFDHGYGNQITTVDASQLTAVDVQLLIDTATAQGDGQAAQILSNVNQVAQLTQNGDNTQSLHIVSENEVAQLAAHLSQHGVIVRSSNNVPSNEATVQGHHLIVSSTQLDARTGQLLMNENQATQIITDAEALQNRAQLDSSEAAALGIQTTDQNNLLRSENVLHFNNRTAVIQIQHNSDEVITSQQVLTLPEQQVNQLTTQAIQSMKDLQPTATITEITDQDTTQQSFIQEEQIVSNITETDVDVGQAYQDINL
ncbi:zinc finger protein 37-like isoform X1 [Clytia hemisphaerica]